MLDGMEIAERTHVVALGISTEGVKIPLGLWEGSTENATLARSCWPTSSTAAWTRSRRSSSSSTAGRRIRRAIKDVFGEHALVHRCHRTRRGIH